MMARLVGMDHYEEMNRFLDKIHGTSEDEMRKQQRAFLHDDDIETAQTDPPQKVVEQMNDAPPPVVPAPEEKLNQVEIVVTVQNQEARGTVTLPASTAVGEEDQLRSARELLGKVIDAVSKAIHG